MGIEILIDKLKESDAVASFRINKQKTILTKYDNRGLNRTD